MSPRGQTQVDGSLRAQLGSAPGSVSRHGEQARRDQAAWEVLSAPAPGASKRRQDGGAAAWPSPTGWSCNLHRPRSPRGPGSCQRSVHDAEDAQPGGEGTVQGGAGGLGTQETE